MDPNFVATMVLAAFAALSASVAFWVLRVMKQSRAEVSEGLHQIVLGILFLGFVLAIAGKRRSPEDLV